MGLPVLVKKIAAFETEARRILASHEASATRTITLEDSYARLEKLSLAQDELFRESLRAVEHGLFRAAHVLGWAGFVDYLHNFLAADGLKSMRRVRPNWQLASVEDLREYTDFQVIEAGKAAGFFSKTPMKALHGLLNKRNECAHPSDHLPDFNETLGYLAELFQRIAFLQKKAVTGT